MRKNVKIALTIVVVAVAAVALHSFYNKGDSPDLADDSTLIEQLSNFEVQTELSEEVTESYFNRFKKHRDAFIDSLVDGRIETLESFRPLAELSLVHRDIGALDKAEAGLLRAYQMSSGSFVVNGNLGDLYYRYLNEPEKAIPYFTEAVAAENPYIETYYSELYEIFRFRLNDNGTAEAVLLDGIERYPEATDILAQLAIHYRELGETEKAIERFHELQDKNPDSVVAKQALAELE